MSDTQDRPTPPSYDELLDNVRNDREYAELPGPEIAMWQEDVAFFDDLSNGERFNERFLEPRKDQPSEGAYILYFFFGVSNNFGILVATLSFLDGGMSWMYYMFCIGLAAFLPWVFFSLIYWASKGGGLRFNRQAQLVHVGVAPGVGKTFAWRDVKPFLRTGIDTTGKLELCLPVEQAIMTDPELSGESSKYKRGRPQIVDASLDFRDHGPQGCMHRFEFYRRYMEEGLDAVQPDPERLPADLPIREPYLPRRRGPILKTLHLLCAGPLIDWALARRAKKFYWPEEVERLCAPGADLSGIDTTPVKPRTGLYYRAMGGSNIDFVDAEGKPVDWNCKRECQRSQATRRPILE